ncbi:MAG: diguanylate cyclase [Pseudomonadota bacterium]
MLDMLLAVVLIAGTVTYAILGVRMIRARREVGSGPLGALFFVMGFWVLGGAIELLADESFYVFSIGRTGHFIGTALLPLVALVTFREYTGVKTSPHLITLLALIPFVSVVFAATNTYHEFMWYLPATNAYGEFLTRPTEWGPWFLFVHAPYSYALIGVAMAMLILRSAMVPPAYRRGLFLLVAACQVPIFTTLAYDFGVGPDTISYVPFALVVMLPFYAWLVLGERLIEFAPLAYETVFQNMMDPVVVIDDEERIMGLNHVAENMLNVNESDALRRPLAEMFGQEATGVFTALESGRPQKMLTDTGRFLHVRASPISRDGSTARGARVLMFRDVSDVERAQSDVRKSEKLLRTLIDHSVNGIVRLRWMHTGSDSAALRCIFANPAAGDFLDIDSDTLMSMSAEQIVRLACSGMEARDSSEVLKEVKASLDGGRTVDREVIHRSGAEQRWLRMIFVPAGDDVTITFIDFTDSKAREDHMESMAWTDPLTGVLNRRGFERDATQHLTDSADDATGALLFIDLNNFKPVNDRFGHEVGDQLLTIAGRRLQKALRPKDIIGRPGGDEFVALVPDVRPEVADRLAYRLTEALGEDYVIDGRSLSCAASIGLALYPEHANTLTGLMREADQAMYRAKARCRDVSDAPASDLLEKAV